VFQRGCQRRIVVELAIVVFVAQLMTGPRSV
jgi:hypothetical protein